MRKVKQGFMLAAGMGAVALLASCSGRSWTAAHEAMQPPTQSAAPAAGPDAALKALASGRFAKAAALNAAVLADAPDNSRAQLGYALAQLGLGQTEQAAARLRALAANSDAPDPDVGLALALAGEAAEGVAILEQAASRPDADARTRQNLALALALADDWRTARTLVERDAGRARATRQLTRWAVWAALPPQDRLAGFLGVVPERGPAAFAHADFAHAEPPLYLAAVPENSEALASVELAAASQTEAAVAVNRPAPQPPAEAPVAARPRESGWVVQLAAFRHTENLESGWQR
ncbi:MAG TPA: tetratricopeptide repeat protein, partial [Pedomonas sp.]|nr:tetratricopeptide repeat protein [Pedomonas sp.]